MPPEGGQSGGLARRQHHNDALWSGLGCPQDPGVFLMTMSAAMGSLKQHCGRALHKLMIGMAAGPPYLPATMFENEPYVDQLKTAFGEWVEQADSKGITRIRGIGPGGPVSSFPQPIAIQAGLGPYPTSIGPILTTSSPQLMGTVLASSSAPVQRIMAVSAGRPAPPPTTIRPDYLTHPQLLMASPNVQYPSPSQPPIQLSVPREPSVFEPLPPLEPRRSDPQGSTTENSLGSNGVATQAYSSITPSEGSAAARALALQHTGHRRDSTVVDISSAAEDSPSPAPKRARTQPQVHVTDPYLSEATASYVSAEGPAGAALDPESLQEKRSPFTRALRRQTAAYLAAASSLLQQSKSAEYTGWSAASSVVQGRVVSDDVEIISVDDNSVTGVPLSLVAQSQQHKRRRGRPPKHLAAGKPSQDPPQRVESAAIYTMESVVGWRICPLTHNILYRVRWKGYDPEEDTWESEQKIRDAEALDLVYKFYVGWNKKYPNDQFCITEELEEAARKAAAVEGAAQASSKAPSRSPSEVRRGRKRRRRQRLVRPAEAVSTSSWSLPTPATSYQSACTTLVEKSPIRLPPPPPVRVDDHQDSSGRRSDDVEKSRRPLGVAAKTGSRPRRSETGDFSSGRTVSESADDAEEDWLPSDNLSADDSPLEEDTDIEILNNRVNNK